MENKKQVYSSRIQRIRELMSQYGIDVYLILSDDFHGSEFVGEYFRVREYVSGFDGSAGSLVITGEEACLWTDGRYFVQAADQLRGTGIKLMKMGEPGVPRISEYLENIMQEGQVLGFDGRTVSGAFLDVIGENLNVYFDASLNLADMIWHDRPEFPAGEIWELDTQFAGKSRAEKLSDVRSEMAAAGAEIHIVTSLDDIAWLLNLRGRDVEYNPVFMAYFLMDSEKAVLYASEESISGKVKDALAADGVEIKPYLQIYRDVETISDDTDAGAVKLMLDRGAVNAALLDSISENVEIIDVSNPAMLMKAVKNSVETENMRAAHLADGAAVTKLIYWLKNQTIDGSLTELDVAEKLEQLRIECSKILAAQDSVCESAEKCGHQQGSIYFGQSFAPIIAAGAHGAIVHYEPTAETNVPIEKDTFLLMDTGGQYLLGTTDITRTVAIGTVTEEQKRNYTAVLRGNLNLASAQFECGTTGVELDPLARSPLQALGLDYNHGTGHGVGYFLNVHEGPNSIRMRNADTAFEPGMITSDEPGVYLENQYGIRLENLILCVEDNQGMLNFETLTLVPFDRDAVIADDMSEKEIELLDKYHGTVFEKLAPFMSEDEKAWLAEATAPIKLTVS